MKVCAISLICFAVLFFFFSPMRIQSKNKCQYLATKTGDSILSKALICELKALLHTRSLWQQWMWLRVCLGDRVVVQTCPCSPTCSSRLCFGSEHRNLGAFSTVLCFTNSHADSNTKFQQLRQGFQKNSEVQEKKSLPSLRV